MHNNKILEMINALNETIDVMTEKNFICCSIMGKQMIYTDLAWQSGGHRVVGSLSFENLLVRKWCYKI